MFPSSLFSFLRRKPHTSKKHGKRPPTSRRRILEIERLEDRVVPAQITQTQTLGATLTNYTGQSLSPTLTQFNTLSGTLTLDSVEIKVSSVLTTTVSGSATNTGTSGDATLAVQVDTASTDVNGPGLATPVSGSATNVVAFGPVTIHSGDTLTIPPTSMGTLTATGDVTLTSPSDLAAFIGAGNLPNYTTDASASASIQTSGANTSKNITVATSGTASVTVIYTYETTQVSINGFDYLVSNTTTAGSLTTATTGNPIQSTTVTLSGNDALGNPVSATTTTDATGHYSFTGLAPSDSSGYTVTETPPATSNHLGQTSTTGGAVTTPPASALVSNIVLTTNGASSTDNFFETQTVSINGFDYEVPTGTTVASLTTSTTGIAEQATTVTLSGTDAFGHSVSQTTTTSILGFYSFPGLNPSNASGYTVTETPPASLLHLGQVSTSGGAITIPPANPAVSNIVLTTNGASSTDIFFEVPKPVTPGNGATATIGFWHNKNGQGLIQSDANIGNQLAGLYKNLFGTGAAPFDLNGPVEFMNLTGQSSSNVAAYFLKLFNVKGTNSYAQVMANVLAAYFDSINNSSQAKGQGFGGNLLTTPITLTSSQASALGLSTSTTVGQYLMQLNAKMLGNNGVLPASLFIVANDVSDMINNLKDV